MNRLWLVPLVVATAASPAVGQAIPAGDCTYTACALRFDGHAVLVGPGEQEAGSFGLFGAPNLDVLANGPDSAAFHYQVSRSRYTQGVLLTIAGGLVSVGAALYGRNHTGPGWTGADWGALGLYVGGLGLVFVGDRRMDGAKDAMSRSIWWYNAALPGRP